MKRENKSKRCAACGDVFIPKSKLRKYCYKCDVKTREKAARAIKVKDKKCAFCGDEFFSSRSNAKFCGSKCRIKYYTRKSEGYNGRKATCCICGGDYVMKSKTNMTCSTKCSRRRSYLRGKEEKKPKDCVVCGTTFMPRRVLNVCCSKQCSDLRARKARVKKVVCVDCGEEFEHATRGVAKRCPKCREEAKVLSKEPCDFCGEHFIHNPTDSPRFCSRKCSALGINAEGIANALDAGEVERRAIEYVRGARNTPTLKDVCFEIGVSRGYISGDLGLSLGDIYARAGRKNMFPFPSKFEERAYLSLLDLGLTDDQIERQKRFPGLYYRDENVLLRFDFHISSLNLLIESDGPQHDLEEHPMYDCHRIRECDKLKEAYAKKNSITLLRVPYSLTFEDVSESVCQRIAPLLSDW